MDPNRIYWQRISDVPGADPGGPSRASTLVDGSGGAGASAAASSTAGDHRQRHRQPGDDDASSVYSSSRTSEPRPPSYVSDDGVGYVINAAPRSTVLFSSDAQPLPPHPAERGDNWRGQPAAW